MMYLRSFEDMQKSLPFFLLKPARSIYWFLTGVCGFVVAAVMFMCFFKVDETVPAQVILRPATPVSSVRSMAGGQVVYIGYEDGQIVTVGKRASLWLQDLMFDLDEVEEVLSKLKLLGCKGTTGTQASFLDLFNGDHDKCVELDKKIAKYMGFDSTYYVSGQTYSRKVDSRVLNCLSSIAQSAHKFSNDIRILQHLKEIEEPFESTQIGSSAMAYKRNPMRSERIASLSRYVMCDSMNPMLTAAEQWFERTLDDSANKRISVPEAFLAVDAILGIYLNVVSGLVVYPNMINKHINDELPFMATENIMMEAVKRGGDRQELHEKIRVYSMEAGAVVKQEGKPNDLLERIANDPAFGLDRASLSELLNPKLYIGRCPEMCTTFLNECIYPILEAHKDDQAAAVYG